MKINLTLPIPPSVNSYWVNSRGGSHKFLSEKARQFRSDVLHILLKENLIDFHKLMLILQTECLLIHHLLSHIHAIFLIG
jgi:Holliday junction resolvase RusA-like endonuclease